MASQRQDFLRKIGKGWTPTHMNLIKPKIGFDKPKKQDDEQAQLAKKQQDLIDNEFADTNKSK